MKRVLQQMVIGWTLAAAAEAASVRYDMDRSADFASFRQVAWAGGPGRGAEAIADRRIRAAIEAELASKGYTLVTATQSDLTVDYVAVVRQRREIAESGGPRFGRNFQLRSQPEGTLIVAFEETKSGRTVWRGAVTDAIASNPERADRRTEKAVHKLLAEFPAHEGP